jgi:hypothetical protein
MSVEISKMRKSLNSPFSAKPTRYPAALTEALPTPSRNCDGATPAHRLNARLKITEPRSPSGANDNR